MGILSWGDKVDLLIEQDDFSTTLITLGLSDIDIEDSLEKMSMDQRVVQRRSGYVFGGARQTSRIISFSSFLEVDSIMDFENKKDEINGVLAVEDPFWVTKQVPESNEMYGFERPGQSTGSVNINSVKRTNYKYRWKVLLSNPIDFKFVGKVSNKLIYKCSGSFTTSDLPFGISVPKTIEVSGSVPYEGTAKNSQLEYPWQLRLTSNAIQSGVFSVKINTRTFTYTSQTNLAVNDVFLIKGFETIYNMTNVNNKTNYEHFVLNPPNKGENTISTSFKGKVEIVNFANLYL